ncbi:MAG: hypothetical protein QM426_08620 [Euryarchaeota archaeon]|nr:hypothetical protein [Euryarchaeota archaeon]
MKVLESTFMLNMTSSFHFANGSIIALPNIINDKVVAMNYRSILKSEYIPYIQ